MSTPVYGYKDTFSRVSFLGTGLILLLAVNLWAVVWIRDQGLALWLLIGVGILGWVYRRMWRIYSKLHYTLSDDSISIHLPNGKTFKLPKEKMVQVERVKKISPVRGRGVIYYFWKNEFHFTTSTSHLLKISMKDGRTVVISPKEYGPYAT